MRHDKAYREDEISEGKSKVSSYVVLFIIMLRFEFPIVVLTTRHRIISFVGSPASVAFETPRRLSPCIIGSRSLV